MIKQITATEKHLYILTDSGKVFERSFRKGDDGKWVVKWYEVKSPVEDDAQGWDNNQIDPEEIPF